jgi:hypothetical protein
MFDNEIPLKNVPDHFFDLERWNELAAAHGREGALESISRPEPGLLTYYRMEVAKLNSADAAKARQQQRLFELGQSLIRDFKAMLVKGQLNATGIQPPSIERVQIPSELWAELTPDFERETAVSQHYRFLRVSISVAKDDADKEVDLVQRCTEWLRGRKTTNGVELKKILRADAEKRFGAAVTVRMFDEAYRLVYRRTRGRPRGPQGK